MAKPNSHLFTPEEAAGKTLGLIGGTTWHSTVEHYRLIIQALQDRGHWPDPKGFRS